MSVEIIELTQDEAFDLICDKIFVHEKFDSSLVARAAEGKVDVYLKFENWLLKKWYHSVMDDGAVSYIYRPKG